MNLEVERRRTDVLIIGGGGAALRAAIEAHDRLGGQGYRVTLVTKGELGKSGVTATACSDRMAFHATLPYTEPGGEDNWRYHADDIYRIGGYVSDANLAGILARNSAEAFFFLETLGVPFVKRPDGKADQFVTDGSKYARACYTGPYTANHIEQALLRELRRRDVEVVEEMMIVDLLVSNGEVCGAVGVYETPGADGIWRSVIFETPSIVLATGGGGEIFQVSAFPEGMSGDGYAMAFRAGAELVNMEFLQIGLCSVKTKLACSGSMMRAVPRFLNRDGEEFLMRYFPDKSPQEVYNIVFDKGASWPAMYGEPSVRIDIAVSYEIRDNGPIYLDYSRNPNGFDVKMLSDEKRRWYAEEKGIRLDDPDVASSPLERLKGINPDVVRWLRDRGIDLERGDMVEIAPAVQHFQGGVKIDERAETTISGLFAAGEVAGGQHGAKRPGGNSLLDTQVFGKIAGGSAADRARDAARREVKGDPETRIERLLRSPGAAPASEVRSHIKRICSRYASVVRTEEGLRQGLMEISELKKIGVKPDGAGIVFALETMNMLEVAEIVMTAALHRRESRGCHMFFAREGDLEPMPTDEGHKKYFVIFRKNGKIIVEPRKPIHIDWLGGCE